MIDNYVIVDTLYSGQGSKVYLGYESTSLEFYAIKIMLKNPSNIKLFQKET